MILVLDTNAYTAFRRGTAKVVRLCEEAETVVVPAVVVGELLAGFLIGQRWEENSSGLRQFLSQPGIRLQPQGLAEAEKYALLVKQLRKAGTPIPTNDIWISATAMVCGGTILTADAHFQNIEGIFLIGW